MSQQALQQVVPVVVAAVAVLHRPIVVAQLDEAARSEQLLEVFYNHTPANFLRRHHDYYHMSRLEAEQYIWQNQVP